jgi:hypothetical protein
MAFPTGWNRRCALVIQHGQVNANQTAFPVLITNDSGCLPTEMVTSGGGNAAQSDGGDIRFSTDAAGTNQLACEIVLWTQNATASLAKAEIWVPVTISSTVDTTIYVWYNAGGGQTQPGAGTTFGSQAVWDSNYLTVLHLADGTTLGLTDSTSHANTATNNGSATATAGKIDGGVALVRNSQFLTAPFVTGMGASSVTFSAWFKTSLSGQLQDILRRDDGGSNRNFVFRVNATNVFSFFVIFGGNPGVDSTTTYTDGAWHYATGILGFSASTTLITLVIDGVAIGTTTAAGPQPTTSEILYIGQYSGGGEGLTGSLDEIRYSSTNRAVSWAITEYNNQNAPGSFILAGTPTTPGGGGTVLGNALYGGINPLQGFFS